MTSPSIKPKLPENIWHEYIFGQVISEKNLLQIQTDLEIINKRLGKLKAIANFLTMQAQDFPLINCFISDVKRTKGIEDDIATFMIKTEGFEAFDVCINTKSDFKIQQIAFKVHNLSLSRRTILVDKLRNCTGLSAPIKRAMTIHRVHNFEIRKV